MPFEGKALHHRLDRADSVADQFGLASGKTWQDVLVQPPVVLSSRAAESLHMVE